MTDIAWELAQHLPVAANADGPQAVLYFAHRDELDQLPPGLSRAFADTNGFTAKPNSLLRASDGDRLVMVVGLGERAQVTAKTWIAATATAARELQSALRVAVVLPTGAPPERVAQCVQGFELGSYGFAIHQTAEAAPTTSSVLVVTDAAATMEDIDDAVVIARSVNFARDLANETPARMTATHLVDIAREIAVDASLGIDVLGRDELLAGGFGCVLAVNAGSIDPPAVITLSYTPAAADASTPHVVLVGKGITFDSGGLSLKQPAHMYDMKGDMGGAAAVLAIVRAARALALPVKVTGVIAATDNLPGPGATKPGEVVRARNGTTVEVLDTDAEGRLVLADALSYASEMRPDAIIDIATLTGYTRTIGSSYSVVHSGDALLRERVLSAAEMVGEYAWLAPWATHYRSYIDSSIADLRNIGDPDEGDPVLAAQFLHEFVGETAWCHLDIGDSGFSSKASDEINKGCTGAMVRTLVELLRTWS